MRGGSEDTCEEAARTAEYPEGLCEAVARAAMQAPLFARKRTFTILTEHSLTDPLEAETKKAMRERENEEAIGGLRNPHKAAAKVAGWAVTDPLLDAALDEALGRARDLLGHA